MAMIETSYYNVRTPLKEHCVIGRRTQHNYSTSLLSYLVITMSGIVRHKNSIELTEDCKHCVILGDVENVADEYIIKLAQWATSLWDYEKIKMWKKSDTLSPGYYIKMSEKGAYKVHVLDESMMKDLFDGARKDSPARLKEWNKKELVAYVDWYVDNIC